MSTSDLSGITDLPSKALAERKIKLRTAERYGVKAECSESTGEVVAHFYPIHRDGEIVGYKKRSLPKSFKTIGDCKGKIDLFGQHLFVSGGKKLLITGGELDAMSAYQMLYEKYPNFEPCVVSLPKGEHIGAVADNLPFLDKFEEILIYTDMDAPGRACAASLCDLVGPKARVVSTSLKDASDMLVGGLEADFIKAFFNARMYVPDGLLTVDDVYEEAIKMPEWGRRWPWPSLDKLTYGRRNGEGVFVGAGVKAGKTEWLSQMVHHITQIEGKKVLLFKFEQGHGETVKAIAGKIANKLFSKPDGDFTQQDLIDAVDKVKDKLILFNAGYQDAGKANLWNRMKGAIRHAVMIQGVQDVFIDPITQITDGLTAADTDVELRRFSNELAAMAKEYGFFYYCFCHLKAPETGKTHEEGGQVKVAQFRGSRAMSEKTKFMIGIARNQYAEDPVERNTSVFHLLLNSGFGKTGFFNVFYDEETGNYLEPNPLQSRY